MRSQASEIKAKGNQSGSLAGSRRDAARKSVLRRLTLEDLEARMLLATYPQALVSQTPVSTLPSPLLPANNNPVDVSSATGSGSDTSNESTPSIAVDKNNPLKLAAVWTRNDTSITGTTHVFVEGAYSNDGGQTWTALAGLGLGGVLANPTTSNPITTFPTVTDASVAFDRNDNLYVLDLHTAGSGTGTSNAVVLNKYSFTGLTPNLVIPNKVIYESVQDTALSPTLAVDDNLASFTDTNSSGQTYTQTDPTAGSVYVAWATNDTPPSNPTPSNFNPNRILMVASSDGGANFSGPVVMNQPGGDRSGSFGSQRAASPHLVVSQGRPVNTAVYGPGDQGVPGGQVTLVYDDFGVGVNANPKFDAIYANHTAGADSRVFNGAGGQIIDATSGTPSIVTPTDFPVNVNINNPNFNLSDLSVGLTILHPAVGDLTITLIPPTGSGLPSMTLVAAGGVSGANLGIAADGIAASTIFTDSGVRAINNQASAAPYMGYYRPQGGSLDSFYGGATAAQLNGTWTLEITDTKNGSVGSLQNWSLNMTSGMTPGTNVTIADTLVRGALTNPYPLTAAVTGQGIGPGISLASDNTLGAYSPYEGRLYVAYVDRYNSPNNPADNTDVFLLASDDGGVTWGPAGAPGQITGSGFFQQQPVNDDLGVRDGYSGAEKLAQVNLIGAGYESFAGRPQFQPQVAVDQATGSVVLTFLDARNDAASARVATYIAASNDGGQSYAPQVFANLAQTATNAITGQTVNLGPVPDNQSGGNPNTDGTYGFGTHQGLAVYGGQIHPIWSSNENGINGSMTNDKEALDIRTTTAVIAAGPRVIDSTMGPVGLPGDTVNPAVSNAPTQSVSAFHITFDRPIDPATFTPADVQVFFRDTTPTNVSGGPVPVKTVVPIPTPTDPNNPNNIYGYTQFLVTFATRTAVGTYSYILNPTISDRIRNITTSVVAGPTVPNIASADVPKPIPDLTLVQSALPIASFGPTQVVSNITVNLTINHPSDNDLQFGLEAPDGTFVLLAANRGAGGQGYINTTFSDSAAIPIRFGVPPFTGTFRPEQRLSAFNGHLINGTWTLLIFDTQAGNSGNLVSWSLSITPGTVTTAPAPGNPMDQNHNGVAGEQPTSGVGPGDAYAAPTPTGTGGFIWTNGQFFPGPYDPNTLPLIVSGPHVVSSHVPGAPVTTDNLVLNGTVSAIDVTFDRDMDPTSITPASILRIMGPAGQIAGPFTILANPLGTDPNPNAPRTYRIGFPTQQFNGTYTISLASTIRSAAGDALDTNLNAGVDMLRGTPTTPSSTVSFPSANTPLPIAPQKTITSVLNVPSSFLIQGMSLTLSINYPFDPDLEASLVGPDGTTIKLFTNVGTTGTQANFNNTTFDDTAGTLIQNGGPPFFGRFVPQMPLSAFNGKNAGGTWSLVIKDDAALGVSRSGSLLSWSLTFQKSVPITGLGEPVADQASVGFRIYTTDPTNALAHNTWTAVGPTSISNDGTASHGYSGQVGAIAVDPSDPSGNTVYVAGASGGIWKTTNFLTTDPNGPTYIPLTDFGPSLGINIGSISVFGRNNDPNQSIIFAATGFADSSNYPTFGNTSQGIGFLRSMDGGATWTLLDSTNNNLPFTAPAGQFQRDHLFAAVDPTTGLGTSAYKILVDPRPTINGQVIVYAALSGFNGGLWRSVDTGQTWQKLSNDAVQGKNATDISFDLSSATIDAVSNPTGNVNTIYAAFQGTGIYISPNRGQNLNLMIGNNFDPLIRDPDYAPSPAIIVANGTFPANPGRIVLAKPALVPSTNPNADVENALYSGWLYAAVATADGSALQGLYLTKDDGQTWTQIHLGNVGSIPGLTGNFVFAVPTNNPNSPQYNMTSTPAFPGTSNYNIAVTVDPTNPEIVYLGGTSIGEDSGLLRIDVSGIYDSHAAIPFDSSRPDGGNLYYNTAGRIQVKNLKFGFPGIGSSSIFTSTFTTFTDAQYTNAIQDPFQPFQSNATLLLTNVNSVGAPNDGGTVGFTNDGSGIKWIPFDQLLYGSAGDIANGGLPSTNIHRMISIVDPLTGHARLIVGDDQGIFSGVDNNGQIDSGIGTAVSANFSRNGNLQIAQFYYGAAQPSNLAAQAALAMAYGNGIHSGIGASNSGVLTNGNTGWVAPSEGGLANGYITPGGSFSGTVLNGETDGVGVQTDQQGRGIVYQYLYPGLGGDFTDFFQVSVNGAPFISRTNGLIQNNGVSDPQWPTGTIDYGNGLVQGNFTVNPIAGDQVIISSAQGRIFSTINQGVSWLVIADPASLDGTYAPALTYGAPDPSSPGGIGNLNNFIYAGTVGGHIFVTTTGGGTVGSGNAWTDISSGLDGSAVLKIVADPTRGSHDAYAVTSKGVYYTANSLASTGGGGGGTTSVWTNITGNVFALLNPAFGNASLSDLQARYLTSIVADWRYVIPADPTKPVSATNPTHPVLYVSGESGVYRSLDNGTTWALYPNVVFDSAPTDGGNLPNAHITDLNLATGNIDPTTGRAVAQPGDPNNLFATTFGRGTFTIRLAPVVFPNTPAQPKSIVLDPSISAGVNASNIPLVSPTTAQPIINGLSEQTAFGNTVRISIFDLTDPSNPRLIGGYDPNNAAATDIAANQTDAFGHYSVKVNAAAFTTNGTKTIGIQATDNSGTTGNIATFTFVLQARDLGLPNPPAQPTIGLAIADDSSGGLKITNVTQPHIIGTTTANVTVALFLSVGGAPSGAALATGTSDANGNYTLQFPNALPDGPVSVQVKATNGFGSTVSPVLNFNIDTHGPTTAPSLGLLPADDTGIKGDGITSSRRPHFVGTTDPGAIVDLFNANNLGIPLGETTADGSGNFSIQLPSDLSNGTITLQVRARDVAGNQGPLGSQFSVSIVTVPGDFNGDGMADLSLFKRSSPNAQWLIQNVTPPGGTPFGSGTSDIPILGDFNGDGKDELAYYRPSTAQWFSQGIFNGVQYGQALVDIPVPADYFGNGSTTIATYRPTTGQWFIANSSTVQVLGGMPGDIPVPGDYDGVGHAEIAIYRPSTGQFFINNNPPIQVGTPGQVPVPGNYDDSVSYHRTEPAVYNPTTGVMTVIGPGGTPWTAQFTPGSIPASADFNGVGRAEPAAFSPATGTWTIYAPGTNTPQTIQFGAAGEVPITAPFSYRKLPVAGDYAGVGSAQLALFRPTNPQAQWRIPGVTGTGSIAFGVGSTDVPIQGDFNGDGKTDIAVYRPSTAQWFVQGIFPAGGITYGFAKVDIPAPADYYGTGMTSLATFRPTTGQWFIAGSASPVTLGHAGDTPVPGNYDGTGKAEVAVFEPAAAGAPTQWRILGANNVVQTIPFGGPKDVPVQGDYDGTGHTQIAVYRPATSQWFIAGHAQPITFGGPKDIPVPGDYDGLGHTQIAVYRPSTGQLFVAGDPPVTLGTSTDIPANAPYVYRTLAARTTTTTKTVKAASLNFGTQAVALSTSAPSTTSAAKTVSAASSTPVPAAATAGRRPNQHVVHPKAHPASFLSRTRATQVHDKALASILGQLGKGGN